MNDIIVTENNIEDSLLYNWLQDRSTQMQIEIGSGNGEFLCALAKRNSTKRFIGVDIDGHRCQYACNLARRQHLDNVVFAKMEGHSFLTDFVHSNLVEEFHIYFPSPYNKSNWIFDESFTLELSRTIKPGCSVRIITDQEKYFKTIYKLFNSKDWTQLNWVDFHFSIKEGLLINSEYERRFGSKFYLQFAKS